MRTLPTLAGILLCSLSAGVSWTAEPMSPPSLAEAVRSFNRAAIERPEGKAQPPLTEEEVVAAVRWSLLDRKKLPVTDETFATLSAIPEGRRLPPGFDLELLTGYEPNDRVTFDVWSIRLRLPSESGDTTGVTIREQMIRSRPIGEGERRVIEEWARRERERGGIGSLERPRWMRAYREARAKAAEMDRARLK